MTRCRAISSRSAGIEAVSSIPTSSNGWPLSLSMSRLSSQPTSVSVAPLPLKTHRSFVSEKCAGISRFASRSFERLPHERFSAQASSRDIDTLRANVAQHADHQAEHSRCCLASAASDESRDVLSAILDKEELIGMTSLMDQAYPFLDPLRVIRLLTAGSRFSGYQSNSDLARPIA